MHGLRQVIANINFGIFIIIRQFILHTMDGRTSIYFAYTYEVHKTGSLLLSMSYRCDLVIYWHIVYYTCNKILIRKCRNQNLYPQIYK